MKRLLAFLNDLIAPRGVECLCCCELSRGEYLCPACRQGLAAMRLKDDLEDDGVIRSAYRYDGVAKRLVLLLKEEHVQDAAQVLAAGMAEALQTMSIPQSTVLTWVTMPPLRLKKRGFDHGRALCEQLGEITGRPVQQLLTRSKRNLHTQRGLSREKRLMNLSGTFRCDMRIETPVLLVDDVTTTGATAAACTVALMKAGAPAVYVLTATAVNTAASITISQKG